MFSSDFWKVLKILYLIVRALLLSKPPNNGDLPDLEEFKEVPK